MKTIIFIITSFFAFNTVFSQETILMMNGNYISGKVDSISTDYVYISIAHKKRVKYKVVEKDAVFSISGEYHPTQVLYKTDTLNGYDFSPEQMQSFINGMQDAKHNYRAPLTVLGGFASGLAGGTLGFWGMTLPTAYVFLSGVNTPAYKKSMVLCGASELEELAITQNSSHGMKFLVKPELMDNCTEENLEPYYQYGYETKAKDKKIKGALKGSIVGFVGFVAATYIVIGF